MNRLSAYVMMVVFGLGAMAAPSGAEVPPDLSPLAAADQQTGVISGTVIDAQSRRPLVGAQILVVGTQFGGLTSGNGSFSIANVPAGEYTIRVQLIGYRAAEQTVTLAAGATATVEIELVQEALALDEMVVTGTAGQARRREIGNTITQINMDEIAEPVANMEALLQGRAAGISVLGGPGSSGAGSQIRLRGNVSVTMSNNPLIYVDGVRVRSDSYPRNVPAVGFAGRSANVSSNPLNDISPSDIERIEVIKGAAATTLYGTEAAAGVIQIFTRRGHTGAASWTAQMDQGFARVMPFGVDGEKTATGADPNFLFLDPWLRNGHRQRYALSVAGGTEDIRYFASTNFEDLDGTMPLDNERRIGIRGNVSFTPVPDLTLEWNTSYNNQDLTQTPSGNNAHGLTLNAYRRDQNYFGSEEIATISEVLDYEIDTFSDRFVTGLTARHTTTPNLTNRLTIGYDLAVQELRQVRPYGFLGETGIMSNKRWSNTNLTLDYVGSYDWRLNPDLRLNVAWGGQTITNEETSVDGYAEDFPGPGVPTLSTGATTLAFEDRIRVITGGFFTQTMFDLRDRYFLTLGVRVDGNSAFGEDFGWQAYPKASLSYVLSDEEFWPAGWGEMKLRSAFGWAGRAPGAFDAVRTWNPVGWGGQPAFRPGNVGNPDLGPERTQEIELGFDGSFLDDRLQLDLTWYQQVTSDALFNVRQVPSMGFLASQLDNVGEIQNQGVELTTRAVAYRSPDWELGFGLNVSTNRSEVRSLGGAPEFALLHFGWIMEGEAAPVIRADRIMNPDEVADPIIEEDHVYGPNMPTLTLQPSVSVRFPRGIEVLARGEYQGGHYMYDGASLNALNRAVRWPTCNDAYPLIDAGQLDQLTARQRMWCIQENVRADWFIYPADFFKLREVSLRAPLPFQIPGATNASVTLSARNAWRWLNSDFPILDPEMTWQTMDQSVRSVWEHVPTPAIFTASVRVNF